MSASALWFNCRDRAAPPQLKRTEKVFPKALWFNNHREVRGLKTDIVGKSPSAPTVLETAPTHTLGTDDPWPDQGLNRIVEIVEKVHPNRLSEIECLEMLFYLASRRKDTRQLAEAALDAYGSLAKIFAQSGEDLRKNLDLSSTLITQIIITKSCFKHILKAQVTIRRDVQSFAALMSYLAVDLREASQEILRAIFLDSKNAILIDQEIARGTVNAVSLYPREIAKKALTYCASSVILAHNHLSGDPRPSKSDIMTTIATKKALNSLGIVLHDHVIIAQRRCFSMHQQNLI